MRRLSSFPFAAWMAFALAACNAPTANELWPPEEAPPFTVVATILPVADLAQDQPRDPILEIRFSDYPDPTTLNFPALRLGPRGSSIQFVYTVSLVDKSITLRPRDHLLQGIDYIVSLDPEIRSLAGRKLSDGLPFRLTFHTGAQLSPPISSPPPSTLTEVLAKTPIRTSCARAGCHTSAGGLTPARGLDFSLPPEALKAQLLSGRRVGITSLLLVESGRPEASYLLRKLLARQGGYVQIEGEPMPPAAVAESAPPLDVAALRLVETWIRQGAN